MKKKCLSILILLTVCLFSTGCGLHTMGVGLWNTDKRSFIDAPLTETNWFIEIPIAITTHANFPVTKILVDISKVPSDPGFHDVLETSVEEIAPGLYQSDMFWTAREPGRYKLMAYSFTGGRINDWGSWTTHTIFLNINEGRGGSGEPIPTPLPTSAAVESVPAPWIDLWADQYNLTAGACTSLRWDAQHVDTLLLDGDMVAFNGSRQVCPNETRTYSLRGISTSDQVEKTITINVTTPAEPAAPPTTAPPAPQPADTSGPSLTNLSLSAAKIFDNSACGPTSNTIFINAQDPSGIARVELNYRARNIKASGAWRVISMSSAGGSSYSAVLNISDLDASLSVDDPRDVDVFIKAWDAAGNMSQSGQVSFVTDYCLF